MKQTTYAYALTGLFVTYLTGFGLLHLLTPDQSFSASENRYLMSFPDVSLQSLKSGDWGQDIETYLTDQWVGKEGWVALKSDVERGLGKAMNHDVYYGKNGRLIESYQPSATDLAQLEQNIALIDGIANRAEGLQLVTAIIPTSIALYPELLPSSRLDTSQAEVLANLSAQFESMTVVNVLPYLETFKTDDLYFKTDHHWSPDGAYLAYVALSEALSYTPYDLTDFTKEVVSEAFYGTLYAKANNYHLAPDTIWRYVPTWPFDVQMTVGETGEVFDSLYVESHLAKRDQYPYFLDGNHALLKIETSVHNGRKLLISKDSYAHVLIPFLALHFEEIHVIDVRYFKLNGLDYMKEQGITTGLWVHNLQTLTTESSFAPFALWR